MKQTLIKLNELLDKLIQEEENKLRLLKLYKLAYQYKLDKENE